MCVFIQWAKSDRYQPPIPSLSWCPLTYPSSTSRNKASLWKKREGRSGLHKQNDYAGESYCARPCGWFTKGRCQKTSRQVWNSESAQQRGGVFADRPLVRPKTPTPSLWCLCAFVNEEILVPWWDIAVSWADSASSVPSTPAQSYSCPTQRNPIRALTWPLPLCWNS